ncbi:MAG: plsY [Moraxellaceae bacterium]|jgi:glycerol-3-phosphate acyltransferase PlsY|nr:plsY [Moraxellaceae bacterium]
MPLDLVAIGTLIFAYLLGSVSTAVIVCQLLGLPDPRAEGSNNPGATNVLRLGGKGPAIITLIGDMLKGVIPVLIAKYGLGLSAPWLAGIGFAAFLGHLFPVFFGFQGGKGVATALGILLVLYWPLGLAVIGLWLITFGASRISSLGSIVSFAAAPFICSYMAEPYLIGVTLMSVVLLLRHHSNIRALIRGQERRFGQKKADA